MNMEKKVIVYQKGGEFLDKLRFLLHSEGMQMEIVHTKEDVFSLVKEDEGQICLFLLEWCGQENRRGFTSEIRFVQQLRDATEKPIFAFSDSLDELDMIATLNAGADDCVFHDCAPLELLARIKAQIRKYNRLQAREKEMDVLKIGDLIIDDASKTVKIGGKTVSMTPMEYKILYLLMKKKGKVLSTQQIYEAVWKMKAFGADNTVAVHVRHIREKIERDPQAPEYLQMVWGQGYKVG